MSRSEPHALSVSELTLQIKRQLDSKFTGVWVEGELSNVKAPGSGHRYFTLKDSGAQLPCALFQGDARRLRFRLDDGMAVLVWGHLSVYEKRGYYQLTVKKIEPRGKGALQLAFEQLSEKLTNEGLFSKSRKKPLPILPQRIGVVTSPTGAAIRDFCRVLYRRFPNLEVVVYPAQVQGPIAAAEIAKGVQVLNRLGGFDAVVLTRGGGSLEDLWAFNEESVARAVAASEIPVVSAVGHEVDVTIADYVADQRAATPSAAAEILVKSKREFHEQIRALSGRLDKDMRLYLSELTARVERLAAHRVFPALQHGVQLRGQRVDDAAVAARHALDRRLAEAARKVQASVRRLEAQRVDRKLAQAAATLARYRARLSAVELARRESARQALGALGAKLETLSPLGVLGRGYSLTWTAQGKLLRRAADVSPGERVRVDLAEGHLECQVEAAKIDHEP